MENIDKNLIKYIEENIFPIYEKNDSGHGIEHIKYVILRSLKFANQFENINLNIVYTVAAFHDLGHHIDKDNHEKISAKMFYENKDMKNFFNEEQRIIIKEAIEDHRASSKTFPRNDYGKIVSSADRNTSLDSTLKRVHSYRVTHFPNFSLDEEIDDAYNHVVNKFGKNGYAKSYVIDEEFDKFKQEVAFITNNKKAFIDRYLKVNHRTKEDGIIVNSKI